VVATSGFDPNAGGEAAAPAGHETISVLLTEPVLQISRVMHVETGSVHTAYRIRGNDEIAGGHLEALESLRAIEVHPGVEKIVHMEWADGSLWAISDPETGLQLSSILRSDGPRPAEWCVPFFEAVSGALDFMASRGKAHGGITPDFIYYDAAAGSARIVGLYARMLVPAPITPYTAPEFAHGGQPNAAADLYSIGAVLYRCVGGKPPYPYGSESEVASAILGPSGPPAIYTNDWFKAIVALLMARSPRDRYRVAVDALDDMRARRVPKVSLPEEDPTIALKDVPVTGEDLPDHVLPGEPGMADPYARRFSVDLLRPIKLLFALPGRLLNAVYDVITMPLNRQPKITDVDGRTCRRPRQRSAFELRVQMLLGKLWTAAVYCFCAFWLIAICHGSYLVYRDRSAVVAEEKGLPNIVKEGKRSSLTRGDVLESGDQPEIVTKAGETITLAVGDGLVHLEENSSLILRRIDYDEGRVRVFELKRGQAAAYCPLQRMSGARFEIVCNGVRTRVPHSARFRVTANDGGATNIQSGRGRVPVITGASRVTLSDAKQAWATEEDGIERVEALPQKSEDALIEQTGGMPQPHPWDGWKERYTELQEEKIVPQINRALTFFRIKPASKSTLMNARALSIAKTSLTALHAALMADGEPPDHLDLRTLKETQLDEETVKSLVKPLEGKKLLAYYKLKGDSYIVFARALDGEHSLIRLDTGKLTVVKEPEEEDALAAARKKYRDLHSD
jgi:hypothetical protein